MNKAEISMYRSLVHGTYVITVVKLSLVPVYIEVWMRDSYTLFAVLCTVNQQILAAIKFGVSQNKVIWRLLNLASPRLCSVRSTSLTYVGGDKYCRMLNVREHLSWRFGYA